MITKLRYPTEKSVRTLMESLKLKSIEIPDFSRIQERKRILLGYNEIEISPHPDCCGAKILHTLCVDDYSDNERVITSLLLQLAMLATRGNSSIQYTVAVPEQNIIRTELLRLGFKKGHSSKNYKTQNAIITYFYTNKNME